jgi:hypothetical protein
MTRNLLAISTLLWVSISVAATNDPMPPAQQNAMIQKYCAVCHTDALPNGRLTLQHFDASLADPADAAMILAKLKTGALGAAGIPIPDKATADAWISATTAQAAGASEWNVSHKASALTASIVREVPSKAFPAQPDLYRFTLTCDASNHKTAMELTWSPATPKNGQEFSITIDGKPALTSKVEGTEKMGNGSNGTSGPGGVLLSPLPLPSQTLAVTEILPGETVIFPFDTLPKTTREACF